MGALSFMSTNLFAAICCHDSAGLTKTSWAQRGPPGRTTEGKAHFPSSNQSFKQCLQQNISSGSQFVTISHMWLEAVAYSNVGKHHPNSLVAPGLTNPLHTRNRLCTKQQLCSLVAYNVCTEINLTLNIINCNFDDRAFIVIRLIVSAAVWNDFCT